MLLAKQEVPDIPVMPNVKTRVLRAKLIFEEAMETINDGLAVDVIIDVDGERVSLANAMTKYLSFEAFDTPDLVKIADGCADLSVVTTGTLLASGIRDEKLLELVDQNNLDKGGPGHYIRDDGKLVKPPNHKPPDIGGLLDSLGRK